MTAILQNAVAVKRVTATAEDEKYKYNVAYEVGDNDKTLVSVVINVQNKEGEAFAGNMTYTNNNSNQQVSAPFTSDMTALTAMFSGILSEIKSTLVTE